MRFDQQLARRNIDARLKKISGINTITRPPKGWIKAIRESLGLTSIQMAKRMGVSSPRVLAIEKEEISGNIKISTLERAANALGCQLVYLILPEGSLDEMVYKQSQKKAKELLEITDHTMKLENQPSSSEEDLIEMEGLSKTLLYDHLSKLWDDVNE